MDMPSCIQFVSSRWKFVTMAGVLPSFTSSTSQHAPGHPHQVPSRNIQPGTDRLITKQTPRQQFRRTLRTPSTLHLHENAAACHNLAAACKTQRAAYTSNHRPSSPSDAALEPVADFVSRCTLAALVISAEPANITMMLLIGSQPEIALLVSDRSFSPARNSPARLSQRALGCRIVRQLRSPRCGTCQGFCDGGCSAPSLRGMYSGGCDTAASGQGSCGGGVGPLW